MFVNEPSLYKKIEKKKNQINCIFIHSDRLHSDLEVLY